MPRMLRNAQLLFILLLVAACTVNPVTGKKQFSLMSASQEVALGQQYYQPYQQEQGGRYVVDPELNVYVNQVGQQLARVSDNADLPYEFVVLNNGTPNAWALPGGKIAVNRGLLTLLEDEAQLAAVLSHEIVHAAARHTAQQMTQQQLLGLGTVVAGIAASQTEYGGLVMAGAGIGAGVWQARYGRGQELQADEYGMRYMKEAGYDLQAAVELQEKFVELSEGRQSNFMEDLFASHPPSQQRVEKNQQLAAGQAGGKRNKAAYQKAIAQVKKDQPAYESHQLALKAAQDKDFSKALTLTNKAISQQPAEALFYATKGQLLLMQKNEKEALDAFAKAAQINPEYFAGHLGQGLAAKRLSQTEIARKSLEKSMTLLPTAIASYHLGELARAAGNRDEAIRYFKMASADKGELGRAAQTQLIELGVPASS